MTQSRIGKEKQSITVLANLRDSSSQHGTMSQFPSWPLPSANAGKTRDSTATYLHLHASHHADLIEEFTRPSTSKLPDEDIYVPPQHQPLNPEDEDDVVPDQHAAFGIQRATQGKKDAGWKDLGLEELLRRAPGDSAGTGAGAGSAAGRCKCVRRRA